MIVYLDGVDLPVENDVKVIHEGLSTPIEDEHGREVTGEMHLTMTHEGLIVDFFVGGEHDSTCSIGLDELREFCT